MAKQLLSVTFRSISGEFEVNVGGNSSDNKTPTNNYVVSSDESLGQVGCFVTSPDSGAGLGDLQQTYLYKQMTNCGYGSRVALLKSVGQIGVNMYLNGMPFDLEGTPQPYVTFESSGYFTTQLVYHRADGTSLGPVYTNLYYGSGGPYAVAVLGKVYTDGTGDVQRATVRPHYVVGIPSKNRYEWRVEGTAFTTQIISSGVIDDLKEYLPIEPEGMFSDDVGEGDFDATSDAIGIPGMPGISPLDTGLVKMYEMTSQEMQSLSTLLWDPQGFVDNIIAMFQEPIEGILNLSMSPIELDPLYLVPGASVKIGNFVFPSVTGTQLKTTYKQIDFGTIYINEFWGTYADYSPYTKLSIFLPYVGVQTISVDDVMNGGVNLRANCDLFTGNIQYFLFSAQQNPRYHGHQSVLYTWSGNMKYTMPITGSNFNQAIIGMLSNVTSSAVSMGISAGTGGAVSGDVGTLLNPSTYIPHANVFSRGSGAGGPSGSLGTQYPYLILERPEIVLPENYEHTMGTPNETTDYIKNYTGFVKIRGVHMEISSATDDEIAEIETLLKGGVIV